MAITVAGEGWIDAFYNWFPAPQWVQVYDRRSPTPIPVAVTPSGGTLPIIADPAGVQVPAVVPGPEPTFNNTQPPPLIPIGDLQLPSGGVAADDTEGENEVALSDWIQGGIDIANAWGQQQVGWSGPSQFAGGSVAATPAQTLTAQAAGTTLPSGMYYDKHGHLVHRRKRRRPCITQTDLGLAWQISNLPNNANVKMFLAKCVR